MASKNYSSKDFASTPPALIAQVPTRLVHRNVRNTEDKAFSIVDLPSKTISLTIGKLEVGQKTRLHRHSYETILFITKGEGYTRVENEIVEWREGDAVFVPVWAWHQHENVGSESAEYIACENAPLLQTLGAAVREEV